MKFRKLYWVTEQIDANGQSEVIGVYTSIYDLTSKGLRWDDEVSRRDGFRVSLVKLDSNAKPFGTWEGPEFSGFVEDLQPFVDTGEFDAPAIEKLFEDMVAFSKTTV